MSNFILNMPVMHILSFHVPVVSPQFHNSILKLNSNQLHLLLCQIKVQTPTKCLFVPNSCLEKSRIHQRWQTQSNNCISQTTHTLLPLFTCRLLNGKKIGRLCHVMLCLENAMSISVSSRHSSKERQSRVLGM